MYALFFLCLLPWFWTMALDHPAESLALGEIRDLVEKADARSLNLQEEFAKRGLVHKSSLSRQERRELEEIRCSVIQLCASYRRMHEVLLTRQRFVSTEAQMDHCTIISRLLQDAIDRLTPLVDDIAVVQRKRVYVFVGGTVSSDKS